MECKESSTLTLLGLILVFACLASCSNAQVFLKPRASPDTGPEYTTGCSTTCVEASPCWFQGDSRTLATNCEFVFMPGSYVSFEMSMTAANTKLTLSTRGDVSFLATILTTSASNVEFSFLNYNASGGAGPSVQGAAKLTITQSKWSMLYTPDVVRASVAAPNVQIDGSTFINFGLNIQPPSSGTTSILMTGSTVRLDRMEDSDAPTTAFFVCPLSGMTVDIDVRSSSMSSDFYYMGLNQVSFGSIRDFLVSNSDWRIGAPITAYLRQFPSRNVVFEDTRITSVSPGSRSIWSVSGTDLFNSFRATRTSWDAPLGTINANTFVAEHMVWSSDIWMQTPAFQTASSFVTLTNVSITGGRVRTAQSAGGPRVVIGSLTEVNIQIISFDVSFHDPPLQDYFVEVGLPSNATFGSATTLPSFSAPGSGGSYIFREPFEVTNGIGNYGDSSVIRLNGSKMTLSSMTIWGSILLENPANSELIYKATKTTGLTNWGNFVLSPDNPEIYIDLSASPSSIVPKVGDTVLMFRDFRAAADTVTLRSSAEYSLSFVTDEEGYGFFKFGSVTCNPSCNTAHSTSTCASTTRCSCTDVYTGTLCDVPPPPVSPPVAIPAATPTATPTLGENPSPPPPPSAPTGNTPTGNSSSLSVCSSMFLLFVAIVTISL